MLETMSQFLLYIFLSIFSQIYLQNHCFSLQLSTECFILIIFFFTSRITLWFCFIYTWFFKLSHLYLSFYSSLMTSLITLNLFNVSFKLFYYFYFLIKLLIFFWQFIPLCYFYYLIVYSSSTALWESWWSGSVCVGCVASASVSLCGLHQS